MAAIEWNVAGEYTDILYHKAEGIAKITINRPEKMNALTAKMRVELTDAFSRAAEDARVVIMTGNGPGFCAGQDLGDVKSLDELDLERTLREEYEPLLRSIHDCPIPVIAAINGSAAGAGATSPEGQNG